MAPQVDEASDSVTLLLNRPAENIVYEVSSEGGELLELWERDGSGQDRHIETVTEVSLVDIRAVCEQCGVAISHHMVGLLARSDGTEYGYRCRICQCVQTDVDMMARHMDSHRPLADTQCRFCSRGLRTFMPQPSRTYTCHACQLVFTSRLEMLKHREIHPPKRRFPCELCDKSFQMKVQLEVHVRTHLGHKPYACDMCPASFTQPSHLINHRRTHTGERPYTCKRCGRAFVQQGHLRAHERTHTGERPYKCDVCGRGFRQSGQLTAHKKLHEGDEPFRQRRRHGEPIALDEVTCKECRKTFKLPKDLKRHMLTHAERAFKCDMCDRSFKRADHLKRHLRQHDLSRKRRRRRRTHETGRGLQPEGLTRLDRVIDGVLDDPDGAVSESAAVKMEEDNVDFRVEVEDGDDAADDADFRDYLAEQEVGNDETSDANRADDAFGYLDQQESVNDETFDDGAEDKNDVRSTRISRAPEDALWSQADRSDDVRWERPKKKGRRGLDGRYLYGRRSNLMNIPATDDGVDEEVAMLTEALRERAAAEKPKRGRGAARRGRGATTGRRQAPEQPVILEPVDWDDWVPGYGGRKPGEDHREEDEFRALPGSASWESKRKNLLYWAKRPEDLVLMDMDGTQSSQSTDPPTQTQPTMPLTDLDGAQSSQPTDLSTRIQSTTPIPITDLDDTQTSQPTDSPPRSQSTTPIPITDLDDTQTSQPTDLDKTQSSQPTDSSTRIQSTTPIPILDLDGVDTTEDVPDGKARRSKAGSKELAVTGTEKPKRGRGAARRGRGAARRGRGAAKESRQASDPQAPAHTAPAPQAPAPQAPDPQDPEQNVILEPMDWDDWVPGYSEPQREEDGDHRGDDDFRALPGGDTWDKKRKSILAAPKVTEDLMKKDQKPRASRRRTAGNWSSKVGVSLKQR